MEWISATSTRYIKRSITYSVVISTKLMGLCFFEVRKAIFIAPSTCSFPLPPVVVLSINSYICHGIQGRQPAENSSSWPIHAPVVGMNLREGGVVLVVPIVPVNTFYRSNFAIEIVGRFVPDYNIYIQLMDFKS